MDVKKFAPETLGNLSAAEIAELQNLTDEQLGELATAYPNKPTGNNYLTLFDTNVEANRQTLPQSSYPILYALRKKHGQKNMRVHLPTVLVHKQPSAATVKTTVVQDLTPDDLAKTKQQMNAITSTGAKQDLNPGGNNGKGQNADETGDKGKATATTLTPGNEGQKEGQNDNGGNNGTGTQTKEVVLPDGKTSKEYTNTKDAVEVIKNISDLAILRAFTTGDERPQITNAVSAQMKKIETA